MATNEDRSVLSPLFQPLQPQVSMRHLNKEQRDSTSNPNIQVRRSNLPFTLNNYKFTALIGHGGFAEVYLVEHIRFARQYCAKVMTFDPSEMTHKSEAFESEINALTLLDHPHILRLYDHFIIGNQLYMILEYCPNGSLHDEIKKTNGLSFERFVSFGNQIVDALTYCHSRNIAHRDIKPGNVLLDQCKKVRIADFGLSLKTVAGQLHRSFGGSFVYTAPEIFQKKAHDPMMGDAWALGVMFATMISGSSPWQCDSLGELKQLAAQGNYRIKKNIPDVVGDLIKRMIVVDPNQRLTMAQIKSHPLFNTPAIPKPLILKNRPSGVMKSDSKLHWEKILRFDEKEMDDMYTDEILEQSEEQITLGKESGVHAASSFLLHAGEISKRVRPRLHRAPSSAVETFKGTDDDVFELC